MLSKQWPSVLLSVVILFGVTICFRRLDYVEMDEVRAFVSVVFGFATSCLLLIFVWLIQRKSIARAWVGHNPSLIDVPCMHPGGVVDTDQAGQPILNTVSSLFDHPPDYEDALIHSKPIDWSRHKTTRANSDGEVHNSAPLCQRHSKQLNRMKIEHSISSKEDCCVCREMRPSGSASSSIKNESACLSSNAQLALSIVRGFMSVNINRDQARNRDRGKPSNRKLSLCQLDVSQLMVVGSPPKYHEISSFTQMDSERGDDKS